MQDENQNSSQTDAKAENTDTVQEQIQAEQQTTIPLQQTEVKQVQTDNPLGLEKKNGSGKVFWIILIVLAVLITAYAGVHYYLYQNIYVNILVEGTSMDDTLCSDDYLVANVKKTDPTYGDIIIIKDKQESWIIKRVIGLGGDTVKIEDGKVFLKKAGEQDFVELDEPYAKGSTQYVDKDHWTLGENEIFYLGDNREWSHDARFEDFGPCTKEEVVGTIENWSITLRPVRNFYFNTMNSISGWFGCNSCTAVKN